MAGMTNSITDYVGIVKVGTQEYLTGSTLFGTCSTAASEAAKVVTIEEITNFTPTHGLTIHILFTNSNTASNPTLQFSSANDATTYPIYTYGSNKPGSTVSTSWRDGAIVSFTYYDGALDQTATEKRWIMNSGIDTGADGLAQVNLANVQNADDLKAIEALEGTSGFLKKTAADTWSLDTNTYSLSDHTHGNITNDGKVTTAITIAQNDYLIVGDNSASGKIGKGPIFSDTISTQSTTTKFLREDGTWAAPSYITDTHHQANLIVGNAATDKANEAVTASATGIFLNLVENNTVRNSHAIEGAGGITIGADANGKITFTGKAGTVTSVTITAGDGITVSDSGTAITGTGTRTISIGAGAVTNTMLEHSTIAIGTQTKALGESFTLSTLVTDLGLSSAMKYKGGVATLPTATDTTTFNTYNAGDVVTITGTTNKGKEYVYNKAATAADSTWVELGDESSFKVKQTAVSDPTVPSSGTTTATAFIDTITQDVNGIITATKKNVNFPVTSVATLTGAITAANLKSQLSLDNVTNDAQIAKSIGTTKGDIIYFDGAADPERLGIGSAGQVLTVSSNGIPSWAANQATDEKVKQSPYSTAASSSTKFNLLFKHSTGDTEETDGVYFSTISGKALTWDTYTGTLESTKFKGNGSELTNVTASSIAWNGITDVPTAAKDVLGVVKTTSTTTSTSNLTASPIINGVVYYKDTHYTTHLYVNKTTDPGTSPSNEAITTSDNAYIHLYDNTSRRDTVQLIGAGGLSITATNAKAITLTSKKYKSTGSADALTSLSLTYNNGSAQTDTVSTSATAIGAVSNGILYIKAISYGTTSVSTGVSEDNT